MKTESRLFIKVQKNESKEKELFSNAANVIGQKLPDLMKLSGTDFLKTCMIIQIRVPITSLESLHLLQHVQDELKDKSNFCNWIYSKGGTPCTR